MQYAPQLAALVDDHREMAYQFAAAGVPSFLFDYPWNRAPSARAAARSKLTSLRTSAL